MKKRILCFGDSNTYGYNPRGGRYDEDTRWTMRLQKQLGEGYAVIEEGFNGRTCVFDDPTEGGFKSGMNYLPPCLMSHSPLDVVILMLGANDCKRRFGMTPMTIGEGMMQLVRLTRLYATDAEGNPPKIILASPVPFGDAFRRTRYLDCFGEEAAQLIRDLAPEYARLSKLLRCAFFDAGQWAKASPIDGVHLSEEGHAGLANGFEKTIRNLLE